MVKWTTPAKISLRQISNYISQDSKYHAKKVTDEIVEKSMRLDTFPGMGRVVPERDDESIREIFCYSYRVIYKILENKDIAVLFVLHGKRNLISDMLN